MATKLVNSDKVIDSILSLNFKDIEARREIIDRYKDSDSCYFGINEDKETVQLSVSSNGMILTTYQNNGWCRLNYYDSDGLAEGETFNGRWC